MLVRPRGDPRHQGGADTNSVSPAGIRVDRSSRFRRTVVTELMELVRSLDVATIEGWSTMDAKYKAEGVGAIPTPLTRGNRMHPNHKNVTPNSVGGAFSSSEPRARLRCRPCPGSRPPAATTTWRQATDRPVADGRHRACDDPGPRSRGSDRHLEVRPDARRVLRPDSFGGRRIRTAQLHLRHVARHLARPTRRFSRGWPPNGR